MPSNVLTFFPLDGYWRSEDSPDALGADGLPRALPLNGVLVDLIPRVPRGFSVFVDNLSIDGNTGSVGHDTSVSFPSRTARIHNGRLSTINVTDTPTISLLAETALLGLTADLLPETDGHLIYDVRFRGVVFDELPQSLENFGFRASTTSAGISLTDETLVRLPYEGP